jgi:hypothetical protein
MWHAQGQGSSHGACSVSHRRHPALQRRLLVHGTHRRRNSRPSCRSARAGWPIRADGDRDHGRVCLPQRIRDFRDRLIRPDGDGFDEDPYPARRGARFGAAVSRDQSAVLRRPDGHRRETARGCRADWADLAIAGRRRHVALSAHAVAGLPAPA